MRKSAAGLDVPGGADRTRGKQVYQDSTAVKHLLEGWTTVAQYSSESSNSIHTVESDGAGAYRCTCQGFRIHKRGFCKHTQRAKDEGLK
jgi:hypothetical protein